MNRAEINPAKMNPARMSPARISPERWREIKPLLESALELDAGDRRAFLDETCAGDESLRREVESLIAAHEQAGDFMEKPAFEEAARMLAEERVAQETAHIYETSTEERPHNAATLIDDRKNISPAPGEILDGRYLIERELEPGGVGQVFLARNLKLPGGAQVVVKVLREQILECEDRLWFEKKFRAEILALSRGGAGKPRTKEEQDADGNNRKLVQSDPLPQTIYRVRAPLGACAMVSIPLRITP